MRAFTLLEVLVSIMIFFVATVAILDVVGNSRRIFGLMKEANDFYLKSSIALLEQKNVKNLYEEVVDFNISDDEFIADLKKEKIFFRKTLDKTIDLNESKLFIYKLEVFNKQFRNQAFEIELK